MKGTKLDTNTRKKILELAEDGVSQFDIAKQCGVSFSTVSKLTCGIKDKGRKDLIPQYMWNEWDEVRQNVIKALERNRRHVRTCCTNRKGYRR